MTARYFSKDLTEQEAAIVGLALALAFMEYVLGAVTGTPAAPAQLRHLIDTAIPMMDELGERFGIPAIDPNLIALVRWKIDNEIEGEADADA